MMSFFYIAAVILLSVYCFMLFLAVFPYLLQNNKKQKIIFQKAVFVSVVVAARNEEKNITKLLDTLSSQHYPAENYEVLIVNDNSSDNTQEFIENYLAENTIITAHVFHIKNASPSKKYALEYAVSKAKGEIILFTDADCLVDEDWISSYAALFQNKKLQFATGKIHLLGKKNLLYAFQQMEWSALMAITASSIYYSFPLMANGANMAIRKQAFVDVNPYKESNDIASGDDMFLLTAVKKRYGSKAICFSMNSQVNTTAADNFFSFIRQRIRWAKKNYFSLSAALFTAVFVLFSQLAAIFLLFKIIVDYSIFQCGFIVLMANFLLEFTLILCYKRNYGLLYFPLLAIIYPFYVCFVAFTSPFVCVRWKGSKTKA
jgi:cellulose synthase/poly-beta-1,6-N-acetylglucosamine synthase-like glycosyltransferase